jgi:hypothetical protein
VLWTSYLASLRRLSSFSVYASACPSPLAQGGARSSRRLRNGRLLDRGPQGAEPNHTRSQHETRRVIFRRSYVVELLTAHRAAAAFFAICFRFRSDSFSARTFPPFKPPSRPRATAAGFLPSFREASSGGAWPVAWSVISLAS